MCREVDGLWKKVYEQTLINMPPPLHRRRGTDAGRPRPPHGLPHVVLILSDQLAHWSLGPANTPHLHALAGRGVSFSHFVASYATCTPSRAALLTGLHPDRLRREEHWLDAQSTRYSIGRLFHHAGYATFYVGKFHLTGDYDNTTAEGLPIGHASSSSGHHELGTLPPGTAGFEHTRYMFHRHSHPKAAVDLDEMGCGGWSGTCL